MNKSPLVSIIIPFYNEEKYLDACLSSLSEQTYKKTEIIVIDDGSTDNSLKVVQKYNVNILHQSHKGPGLARNYGAKHSKGKILVFADADMRYDISYIEKLIEPIIKGKALGTFNKDELLANPENIWADCWRINSNLPRGRHSPVDLPEKISVFRAINKNEFVKVGGFNPKRGYFDDVTLSEKLRYFAVSAPNAVSYHFNPTTLKEVFTSARWIGRGLLKSNSIESVFRYSFLNSVRISVEKIQKGAPISFLVFKLIYDAGMLAGIFLDRKIAK